MPLAGAASRHAALIRILGILQNATGCTGRTAGGARCGGHLIGVRLGCLALINPLQLNDSGRWHWSSNGRLWSNCWSRRIARCWSGFEWWRHRGVEHGILAARLHGTGGTPMRTLRLDTIIAAGHVQQADGLDAALASHLGEVLDACV